MSMLWGCWTICFHLLQLSLGTPRYLGKSYRCLAQFLYQSQAAAVQETLNTACCWMMLLFVQLCTGISRYRLLDAHNTHVLSLPRNFTLTWSVISVRLQVNSPVAAYVYSVCQHSLPISPSTPLLRKHQSHICDAGQICMLVHQVIPVQPVELGAVALF